MSIKLNGQIIAKSVLSGTELNELLTNYATASALSEETARATTAETTLTNNLAAEIARAEAAEAAKLSASDTTVTKQGNTFNGASQLVQLNSSGQLPALNGVNLIGLTASQISNASTNFANINLSNLVLANALTNLGFTGQSVAQNGYYKLPNGLIIQWGKVVASIPDDYTNTVTFPIAFPTSALMVTCSPIKPRTGGRTDYAIWSLSATQLVFLNDADTIDGFFWFALGY